jgi:hypothetical protein
MRRWFASLLVLVFSLPLIAPALASAPGDSQLPACCRRGGKHQCAMSMEANVLPRWHVVRETCPFSPFAHTPLLQPHAYALIRAPFLAGFPSSPAAVTGSAEAGYRISADRTRQKRGPPSSLLL